MALQNAFWRLLDAETFEGALVATVSAGRDADSNAAARGSSRWRCSNARGEARPR